MDAERIKRLHPKLEGAIWRGWNEVHLAVNARKLLLEIHEPGQTIIDSRKGLIFTALEDNVRLRLARLLDSDNSKQSAGFEYVKRCWNRGVEEIAARHCLDLDALDDLRDRLKAKRDLTFVHIDKRSIGKAAEIWDDNPIRYREIDEAIRALRILYAELYKKITGNEAPFFHLVGDLPVARVKPSEIESG